MKKLLPALLLAICNNVLPAQEYVDLLKLSYSVSPNNQFDSTDQSTTIHEYSAEALVPIPLKNGNAIITGLVYEQQTLRPGPSVPEPIKLHVINPRLGINWNHNEKWSGQYLVLPQIASDLTEPLAGHDFQMGAIALLSYKKSKDFHYRFGAYYNSALYGPGTFLIAGFYYKSPNEKWTFDFTLPIWADINYKISDSWSVGIRQDDMLRSYYLNDPLFTNDDEYIVQLTPNTFAYLQLAVAKNYIFQFKVGHSIGRHYRVFNVGDQIDLGFTGININDDRNQLSTDFENGLIFQFRFHYRFFLKDSTNPGNSDK